MHVSPHKQTRWSRTGVVRCTEQPLILESMVVTGKGRKRLLCGPPTRWRRRNTFGHIWLCSLAAKKCGDFLQEELLRVADDWKSSRKAVGKLWHSYFLHFLSSGVLLQHFLLTHIICYWCFSLIIFHLSGMNFPSQLCSAPDTIFFTTSLSNLYSPLLHPTFLLLFPFSTPLPSAALPWHATGMEEYGVGLE